LCDGREGIFPKHEQESSTLELLFKVWIKASLNWQRIKMSDLELAHLRNKRNIIFVMT
jgi:hypothetical protein